MAITTGGDSDYSGGSSARSSHSRRRRPRFLLCKCGFEAPLVTAWSNENDNIGRRFYGCGRFKEHNMRECDFFLWFDELEENPHYKKIIGILNRKIDGMKMKQDMLIKMCVLGWFLAVFFVVVTVMLIIKLLK